MDRSRLNKHISFKKRGYENIDDYPIRETSNISILDSLLSSRNKKQYMNTD